MVCMNILRSGRKNFVGCTNENYNASRWLEQVGNMPKRDDLRTSSRESATHVSFNGAIQYSSLH